jgi:hypothetical protein
MACASQFLTATTLAKLPDCVDAPKWDIFGSRAAAPGAIMAATRKDREPADAENVGRKLAL